MMEKGLNSPISILYKIYKKETYHDLNSNQTPVICEILVEVAKDSINPSLTKDINSCEFVGL